MWRELSVSALCCRAVCSQILRGVLWDKTCLLPHHFILFFRKRFLEFFFVRSTSSSSPPALMPSSWKAEEAAGGWVLTHLLPFCCAPSLCALVTEFFWLGVHQQPVPHGFTVVIVEEFALFTLNSFCSSVEQLQGVIERLPPGLLMKLIEFSELLCSE